MQLMSVGIKIQRHCQSYPKEKAEAIDGIHGTQPLDAGQAPVDSVSDRVLMNRK